MNTDAKLIDCLKVNHDTNGNPRFVCHFLNFINEGDRLKAAANRHNKENNGGQYRMALNKANKVGGKKYNAKNYGGGIIFQAYSQHEVSNLVAQVKEVNTEFLKEWDKKQFRKAEKAILNHFRYYTYQHQISNYASCREFRPNSWEEVATVLGLAYTSSSEFAGYWVAGAGTVWANEDFRFYGFAINTDGQVIGLTKDKAENFIYIDLEG